MKTIDYIVLGAFLIIDVLLFIMRGCPLDVITAITWLAVIAAFVIVMMIRGNKKKKDQNRR